MHFYKLSMKEYVLFGQHLMGESKLEKNIYLNKYLMSNKDYVLPKSKLFTRNF